MNPLALRIIRDEHQALAAMLRSMPLLVARAHDRGEVPDFAALRAMLFYVDEFPERLHHPKESELLFAKLRARAPQARAVLDGLEQDHQRGEMAVRDLQHALLAYELMGQSRREPFERLLQRYVQSYLKHMAIEEREILPLALQLFSHDDWDELDEAFAGNRDPLTGHTPAQAYEALFQRILTVVPPPLGLGA
jgi:hemerythrin-like domain-containing protein